MFCERSGVRGARRAKGSTFCGSRNDERGTVTAELAIAIPSVLMILGLVMGTARVGIDSVSASALAHDAVRAMVAGGTADAAATAVGRAGAKLSVDAVGCVTVRFPAVWGLPSSMAASARACAG